jgi:hypothetical protein
MKKSQARGYLLEIVLSKLIEINGYDVIRMADNVEIVSRRNGLNVRGRGGFHQFDTLGRFKITPPFVYPLRLFVEAKFYDSNKVGIDRVRMGVGILEDVNTNYSTVQMNAEELSIEKYQYHYAIFSTSGFTEDAQRFAIAHKIHLIDLTGDEYRSIIDLIREIVERLNNRFPDGNDNISKKNFSLFKEQFSKVIRGEISDINGSYDNELLNMVYNLKRSIDGKLVYLATANSPYIIPLFSNTDFNETLRNNPHQDIAITWEVSHPNKWSITSRYNQDFKIQFTLPNVLLKYMISDINHIDDNAMNIKENRIGKLVFIAYLDGHNPTLCTLEFYKTLHDK